MLNQKINQLKTQLEIIQQAKSKAFDKMRTTHLDYVKQSRAYGDEDIRTATTLQQYETLYAQWDKLDDLENALEDAITSLRNGQFALEKAEKYRKELFE